MSDKPENEKPQPDDTGLTPDKLMGFIGGEKPPHEAFADWIATFDPELAKELRESHKPEDKPK